MLPSAVNGEISGAHFKHASQGDGMRKTEQSSANNEVLRESYSQKNTKNISTGNRCPKLMKKVNEDMEQGYYCSP